MSDEFEIGDTVQLKSGSPSMTVSNIGDHTHKAGVRLVTCTWWNGSEFKEAPLDARLLTKVEVSLQPLQ